MLLGYFLGDAIPRLGENIDKLIIVHPGVLGDPDRLSSGGATGAPTPPGAEIGPQDGGPDRDIMGRDVD